MSMFAHNPDEGRLSMPVDGGEVFAEYSREGNTLLVSHVEASPELRGKGAADRFMHELISFAREENLKIRPLCAYAAHWMTRRPDTRDVLATGF